MPTTLPAIKVGTIYIESQMIVIVKVIWALKPYPSFTYVLALEGVVYAVVMTERNYVKHSVLLDA
jgi:hypothetical protein